MKKKRNPPAQISRTACAKCRAQACVGIGPLARCEKHFTEDFDWRVRKAVREYRMIRAGEHVAVALSGGKDSTVLLHQLVNLREKLPMKISAILIDEGISGYRAPTILVAKKECRRLKVPLHILSFKKEFGQSLDLILKKQKAKTKEKHACSVGACSYCGVFRRQLLQRGAERIKADKLALGHNLDDAAQTVLLNLYRNEPARLARFWPISDDGVKSTTAVPRIRPLILCAEKEVALWAALNSLPIHYGACPYASEAMRQTVRTQLNAMEDRYPGTKLRIFKAFVKMRKGIKKEMEAGNDDGNAKGSSSSLSTCPKCGEMSAGGECAACKMLGELRKR